MTRKKEHVCGAIINDKGEITGTSKSIRRRTVEGRTELDLVKPICERGFIKSPSQLLGRRSNSLQDARESCRGVCESWNSVSSVVRASPSIGKLAKSCRSKMESGVTKQIRIFCAKR